HETIISSHETTISWLDTVVSWLETTKTSGEQNDELPIKKRKDLGKQYKTPYAMAEYIMRELPDMDGSGEKKYYYQIRTFSHFTSKDFVRQLCRPGSGLSEGDVIKVMSGIVEEMNVWLSLGHTVTIDGLGTFSLSISVTDDVKAEDFEGNKKKVTGKQIKVRGVKFRPNKQLVKDIGSHCKLYKSKTLPNNRSPYTREERLKMAQDYLAEHHFMRVKDYESMTKLPHSTAANELRDFCIQPTGITFEGRGNTKVYMNRQPYNEKKE
ncbi:MAG: hypothetical protein Q4E55_06175, partial [Bacteroidales bacterium]|nr:hypothetical protein [Bacteroidales bacterium]